MTITETIACWRCGETIAADLFPLRREEVCPHCDADVHVCRQCSFYNASVSDGCDEPIAGGVTNKERANFCDYFKPSAAAWNGAASPATVAALDDLNALFGDGPTGKSDGGSARDELDRLFGLADNDEP